MEGQVQRLVVIADDDRAIRDMLEVALGDQGYRVEALDDGLKLLERLRDVADAGLAAPDLVVTDVRMPGCSGLRVLAWVRREMPQVPVVVISAFGDGVHQQARDEGAVAVVEKPFDLDELEQAVRTAMD